MFMVISSDRFGKIGSSDVHDIVIVILIYHYIRLDPPDPLDPPMISIIYISGKMNFYGKKYEKLKSFF